MNTSSSSSPDGEGKAPVTDTPINPLSDTSSQASNPVSKVVVVCSSCKATLRVRREYVGNAVKCKQCGQIFTVPAEVDTAPALVLDNNHGDLPSRPLLASERDDLTALVKVLRDENRALHTKLLSREDSINQLEKRVLELVSVRAEHDALAEKVEKHERAVCDVRAERDALSRDLDEHKSQLSTARAEHIALAEKVDQRERAVCDARTERDALARDLDEHRSQLGTARAEHHALAQKVELHERAVCDARAERDALARDLDEHRSQLGTARAEHDALAEKVGLHERAVCDARTERDALARNVSELESELVAARAEHDALAEKVGLHERAVCDARAERDALATNVSELESELANARTEMLQSTQRIEQSDSDLQVACRERERLSQELAQCRSDLCLAQETVGRVSTERQSALDSVEELTKTLAERDLSHCNQRDEYDTLLMAERKARQELADEVGALRENAEETARVAEQLISANSDPPKAPPAASDQLEAARVQAEELKFKLAEADWLYRVMSETLNSIGIQIDLPGRPRETVRAGE